MKKQIMFSKLLWPVLSLVLFLGYGCKRDVTGLSPAGFPKTGDVFINDFTGDLAYSAFGGSDVKAFQVDKQETYGNTSASMRFAVPDAESPQGSYAGGVFFSKTGRDLSGFNALTFYIKATQPANIGVIGFGNDLGASMYQVSISGLAVNTNWKKVIIPIPDPSKLTAEKGMLFVSAGPENGRGYTFWIDEVKFENLGTINNAKPLIYNGADIVNSTAFIGYTTTVTGLSESFSLPDGTTQTVNLSKAYFNFQSSTPSVATVSDKGVVNVVGAGTTVISATVGNVKATGSLTLTSTGKFVHASTPTVEASRVISIFSNAYSNIPVEYYNGYWAPYQTTQSADFTIEGDNVLAYANFNFVGTKFAGTVDASAMTHAHFDIYVPVGTSNAATLKITIRDFGADGADGGSDDTNISSTFTASKLIPGQWNSVEIPIKGNSRSKLGMIIYEGSNLSNFFVDNIYLYKENIPTAPTVAAPAPTQAASGVISLFSDTYTNLSGTDFNPNWGQATVVTQQAIAGNNTLVYKGLNYQGTQFTNTDVSGKQYLHLDYWSTSSTVLKVFLISPGKETPVSLTVPTSNTGAWSSIDIPLSDYASVVDLTNVFQLKIEGNGDIWFDNIYFHGTASSSNTSPYCAKTVYHFMNTAETASAINLTITNTGAQSVKITIESTNNDAVDDLIINSFAGAITGSPSISAADVSVAGKISKTLTWTGTPPATFGINILWSKASTAGNWMLQQSSDITIKFSDKCN